MGRILDSDLPREVAPIVEYHTPSCRLEVVERGVTPPPQPPNQLAESWYPDHLPHARLEGGLSVQKSGLEPELREGEKVDTCYI